MGKNLVVRDCYVKMFKEMGQWFKEKPAGLFVVTGTPGIGKSVFMGYVAARLAANNIPFVIQRGPNFWSRDKGGPVVKHGKVEPEELLQRREVVFLFDPFDATSDLKMLREVGRTIIFTSPSMKSYNAVWKQLEYRTRRFMPIWSLEELQKHCQELFPPERTEDEVKKVYEDLGGSLRWLRRNLVQGETAEKILKDYIKDRSGDKLLDAARKAAMCPEEMSAIDSHLSYLFPIHSETPFKNPKVSFLDSEVATKMFAAEVETWDQVTRIGLVRTMLNLGSMGTFIGKVWETVVKTKLHNGPLELQYRAMCDGAKTSSLTTPQKWLKLESDTPKGNLELDTLYEPPPNFATTDLFFVSSDESSGVVTLWLLQATKAKTHDCKMDSLQTDMQKYFTDLDKIAEIVWMVIVPKQLEELTVYRGDRSVQGQWWWQDQEVPPWQCVSFLNV